MRRVLTENLAVYTLHFEMIDSSKFIGFFLKVSNSLNVRFPLTYGNIHQYIKFIPLSYDLVVFIAEYIEIRFIWERPVETNDM